jgi:hypothetical protein
VIDDFTRLIRRQKPGCCDDRTLRCQDVFTYN